MHGLPFTLTSDSELSLISVDLGLARALYAGVPASRLLARMRLARDELDLVSQADRATGLDLATSGWDRLMAHLLASDPEAFARIKAGVERHARAGAQEGPLEADDEHVAAVALSLLAGPDLDSSLAESAILPLMSGAAAERARAVDPRLGALGDRRGPAFEACLRLARGAHLGPWSVAELGTLTHAIEELTGVRPLLSAVAADPYPWGDADVPVQFRRVCLLERGPLERVAYDGSPQSSPYGAGSEADPTYVFTRALRTLLRRNETVGVAARPRVTQQRPQVSVPPASWLPTAIDTDDGAKRLAQALERGATTLPAVRARVLRGGDPALEAISREMLEVSAHPYASCVFAEILAIAGRERDVVRLISHFAVSPDPSEAAHALSLCERREVPEMLRAWLEESLARHGSDPAAAARLRACIDVLEPYPHLYEAVRPLVRAKGGTFPPTTPR